MRRKPKSQKSRHIGKQNIYFMKSTMTRTFFILALALGAVSYTHAQKFDLGVQFTPSIPLDDGLSNTYDLGLGGKLTGEYYFNDNIAVGLDFGFHSFSETIEIPNPLTGNVMSTDISLNVIPIQATGAYHLDASDELDFYGGLGAGLALLSPGEGESRSELAISPRVGASYELTDELRANLNFSYLTVMNSDIDSFQLLNINVGVTYTLMD